LLLLPYISHQFTSTPDQDGSVKAGSVVSFDDIEGINNYYIIGGFRYTQNR